ncbi:hypothetical protein Tco_0604887 [Tanacetum coccineum]
MTRTVPSKSTANVFYQGTARPRVPHAVLSQSTGRPYYPRMDNIRPRTSSFSPSTRSSTTRTPHRPQRPKKIMKSIWVKKRKYPKKPNVGSQTVSSKNCKCQRACAIDKSKWRPKGAYLDSVIGDNGSYTLKHLCNPEEDLMISPSALDLQDLTFLVAFSVESTAQPTQSTARLRKVLLRQLSIVLQDEHSCSDFHQIVDYLTGCSINYSLLVDPDLIGPWLQQFWATASLRADLLFDDADGIDCFPKQVLWDSLRDIGYEGTSDSQGIDELTKSQTSGGDEGLLDLYALNREVRRLKKQTISQAKQIHKLKVKLKKLSKGVKPVVKHHTFWVKFRIFKKRRRSKELDLEKIQSTARQSTVTPRTLNFDDETGPSSPIRSTQEEGPKEQFKDDELLADILLNRPRGLSIPGPMQSQPQQPIQATDPKEKGKGILVEEPKKKKLTLQQIRALETAHDEEIARKAQEEWNAEEERKRLEDLKKPKPKTISKKPTSLAQERTQMMNFLKGQGYKNLKKLRYPQMKELYDKVQESIKDSFKDFIPMDSEKEKQMLQERDAKRLLRKRKATVTEEQPSKTIDELRNYLRIVDFEKSAQDRESLEAISMITEFKVIDSPDGEYLIIYRANSHFRAFDTLWEILHHFG